MRWGALAWVLVAGVAHAEREPRAAQLLDEATESEGTDKKSAWLADKAARAGTLAAAAPAAVAVHPLSLRNTWTDEVLPLPPDAPSAALQPAFERLLRCHFTQQPSLMAVALLPLVRSAAARFGSQVVEIVSGYRAPKYQLMLRKKGHEVARDSAHPRGEAVDFRLPAVPTRALLSFVRKRRLGGVGYYPASQFVHADVGRIRYWKGH